MRFLSKIVFINSAHIRYAEVAMDGNVHFTGTQGVGKTTLLRALLFFYNANKDKLGLRVQGQRSFDDYYVPTPASYIIYEVSRGAEERPFAVILFRHNNRAAFRFVDAPYNKDWFIDSLGVVAANPIIVRQRIQNFGIDSSSIIERYNQYRDILYGNRNASTSKDLLKYYLLKSRQYQNIPRIIQNVFLNERVDADFIKNTIINSITAEDEEISVDLNFFRSKLIHFSDELKDINLWTAKNRQGDIETQRDADKIIDIAHNIRSCEFALHEQCGMLIHSRHKAERDIPILQNKITKKQGDIDSANEKIRNIQSKFENDHGKITGDIAVLASKLKEASNLKKHYRQIGIEDMLARAATLDTIKLELSQKERLLAQLKANYQSISQKYDLLRDRINIDKEQYLQKCREKQNRATGDFNNRNADRLNRRVKLESGIQTKIKAQTSEIDEILNSCRELLHEQEMQRVKASQSSPMKADIERCKNNIDKAERKIAELTEKKLTAENRLDSIRNKFDMECQRLENETALQIAQLENSIARLQSAKKDEMQILDKSRGSLCEWLDQNMDSWETSIGKILDEKNVLYGQHLNPQLTDNQSDTVFGVSLDLESIEKEVRTPAIIKESISSIETEINSLCGSIINLREENDRRIAETGKESKSEIKSLRSQIDNISQEIRICSQQSKEESLRLEGIKADEKERLAEIDASFDEKIRDLRLKIESLRADRTKIEERGNRELRGLRKSIEEEQCNDELQLNTVLKSIDDEIEKYKNDRDAKVKQLENDEKLELSESGADARMLESVKQEISAIKAEIDNIDKERDIIAVYTDKCKTLLNFVPQYQADKKRLEDEDASLRQKYEDSRQKHELKKQEDEKTLAGLRNSFNKATTSIQKADEFMASGACPPEIKETRAIATELDCVSIISTIRQLNGEIYRLTDTLKSSINEFRRRFSANNTFKFPVELDTAADYHHYADSLEDFVSNDKIKEFQQITSNLYRDILSRAAADFNVLLGRESEILRIVKDINYDFEKKTFAGVIRRIELKLFRSAMPIITQLQNITDFWNTHQYELGEINLFSTDEHQDVNRESIKYLKSLTEALTHVGDLKKLTLDQTFSLKFKIQENDNETDWIENIKAVGSEGTDILVKSLINILLISVFKKRAGQSGDFRIHCMMDEIGRLADENIQGILNFANERDIYVVNSSPKAHRPLSYRRIYMLSKDKNANTLVQQILSTRESELQ